MEPPLDPDAVAARLAAVVGAAGRFLASLSERGAGRVVKADGTPSTGADREAERLIVGQLRDAFPTVAVVAEESAVPHGAGEPFFLVDPLDGTRDFLAGSEEYSVNVALVRGDRPVAAALAAPGLGRVWYAGSGEAWEAALDAEGRVGPARPVRVRPRPADGLVALGSRRHGDPDTERCLERLPVRETRAVSSAAKFGLIASGEADLYVRCGPTMEWDTAAGDHVLSRAGGIVVGPDGEALRYGAAACGYLNGPFAALADPGVARDLALPSVSRR